MCKFNTIHILIETSSTRNIYLSTMLIVILLHNKVNILQMSSYSQKVKGFHIKEMSLSKKVYKNNMCKSFRVY